MYVPKAPSKRQQSETRAPQATEAAASGAARDVGGTWKFVVAFVSIMIHLRGKSPNFRRMDRRRSRKSERPIAARHELSSSLDLPGSRAHAALAGTAHDFILDNAARIVLTAQHVRH